MQDYGVWEPYSVKAQTIKTAIEVSHTHCSQDATKSRSGRGCYGLLDSRTSLMVGPRVLLFMVVTSLLSDGHLASAHWRHRIGNEETDGHRCGALTTRATGERTYARSWLKPLVTSSFCCWLVSRDPVSCPSCGGRHGNDVATLYFFPIYSTSLFVVVVFVARIFLIGFVLLLAVRRKSTSLSQQCCCF